MFPGVIALVEWPARICDNNHPDVDSPGEYLFLTVHSRSGVSTMDDALEN
jgi:hypothetical protein